MIENTAAFAESIAIGLAAGTLYGTLGYVANRRQSDDSFDVIHFGSSLAVSIGIATFLSLTGTAPTESRVTDQLAAYAGLTFAIERVLRSVIPPEYQRRLKVSKGGGL